MSALTRWFRRLVRWPERSREVMAFDVAGPADEPYEARLARCEVTRGQDRWGDFDEVWVCDRPPDGQAFRVVSDWWGDSMTRYVYEIEPVAEPDEEEC